MLEGTDVQAWLQRSATYQLKDYFYQSQFETAGNSPEPAEWEANGGMNAAGCRAQLMEALRQAGLNSEGRVPTWTDLYSSCLAPDNPIFGALWYRMLAGHAHGFQWPLFTYDMIEVARGGATEERVVSDDRYTVQMATLGRTHLQEALLHLEKLAVPFSG
jgi:hypothetical protein